MRRLTARTPQVSHAQAAQLGWTRVDERPWRKLLARWRHRDGWRLVHCGHPTANHPWALYDPKGRMHLAGGIETRPIFGSAWNNLTEPMRYVADHAADALARMDDEERVDASQIRWARGTGV